MQKRFVEKKTPLNVHNMNPKTGLQNYLPPCAVEVRGLSTVSEDYPSSLLQQ
jgi:hypothetical protein